jgi:uncharacterized protein (DUF433 family)
MTIDEIYEYIEVTPFNGGDPVFWGTRITPEHILKDLSKGMSTEEVLKEHPQLTAKHIEAAFVYRNNFPTDKELLFGIIGPRLFS